jgi:flavin reductase
MSWIDQRPDDAMDGSFTVVAPEPVVSVEAPAFREAMSRLGAAVHIVTTAGPAGKTGFTATAVCSVSDQPAMLLVCLNRRSNSAPLLSQNGVFCINTLGAAESNLADMFAGRSGVQLEARFSVGEWLTLKTGSPVLASAVVAFDCRTIEIKAVASHNVIFGAVHAVRLGPSGPALVYHDRAYKPV